MQEQSAGVNFLILTAHDFRTPRWASVHFIARELAARGRARVFSLRYSLLSKWRPDPRHGIDEKANKVDTYESVDCYLWKTPLHPFNFRRKILEPLEPYLYRLYVWFAPLVLRQWIGAADTVIIESGTGLVFYPLIKKINPRARVIYLCSDSLASINCSQYVRAMLVRFSSEFDACIVRSRQGSGANSGSGAYSRQISPAMELTQHVEHR
jgi:2-beta-glucuronyltransferase